MSGESLAASNDLSDAMAITPFTLTIPESALQDLKRRLQATRWPERETVADGSQGVPLARLQALVEYSAEAARLYWENAKSKIDFTATAEIDLPVGCSIFPKELFRAPRSWAQLAYRNIIHWNEVNRGGHFAAFEQPEIFVDELRTCFRSIR